MASSCEIELAEIIVFFRSLREMMKRYTGSIWYRNTNDRGITSYVPPNAMKGYVSRQMYAIAIIASRSTYVLLSPSFVKVKEESTLS